MTQKIRFEEYKKMGCPIVLGHNKNDCVENIITNISSRKNYDNLKGMKQISKINDVDIVRPILNIGKKEIKDFAKTNKIPFLEDSTPKWSRRGKLRDLLIPKLNEVEPGFLTGLNCMIEYLNKKMLSNCNECCFVKQD